MGQKNLKKEAANGMVWTAIQKYLTILVTFISGIVLARLLTPTDYGCIGMLAIFMVVSESIVNGGFGSALIQKKRPTQDDYSTVFYWNIAVAVFLYIVLYFSAPAIARFYNMPLLSDVLRVQGIVLIFYALCTVQANILRKQLKFKKIAIVMVITCIVSVTVTILMAYNGYGVWSLVAQNFITVSLPTIIYWVTNKWLPLLRFSKKSFKELFSFGFYTLLSSLLRNICNNIQGLLIGKFFSPSVMGYYSKALTTEHLSSHSISQVVEQVSYPLYAEVQDNNSRLISMIRRLTMTISFISFPLLFLLILLAKPIFIILYTDRWLDSIPFFQILCLAGLAICLQSVNSQPILAIGKSRLFFYWNIVKRVAGLVLMIGGLWLFGMHGLLFGMVLQSWLIYFINAGLVSKYIGYTFLDQLKGIFPNLLLSLLAFAAGYAVSLIPGLGFYLTAAIQLVVFLLVFVGGSVLFKNESLPYCKQLFVEMVVSKFKR